MILGHKNPLTDAEKDVLIHYKKIIFKGFLKVAAVRGVENLGILVDEDFGKDIHLEARQKGIRNALSTEKSGQQIYAFEYDDWKEHLRNIRPTYAKALVRWVAGEDHLVQNQRLRELSDFCKQEGFQFLLEPLVFPTAEELESVGGDKKRFDMEVRPRRFADAVAEFHAAGITPDVWKIEGTETKEAMDICSKAVFSGGKPNPEIIILGRGESAAKVDDWLRAGAKSRGVTGFAVGRTIFADALKKLHDGVFSEEAAETEIADWYEHFISVFETAKG